MISTTMTTTSTKRSDSELDPLALRFPFDPDASPARRIDGKQLVLAQLAERRDVLEERGATNDD
jgi:hypothetical protein